MFLLLLELQIAPDHGVTYEELSQKADELLLAVKRENKKRVSAVSANICR